VNDMRASRTWNILKADTVYGVESNRGLCVLVSIISFSGVCVVGMYEIVQPRNLGGPCYSYYIGSYLRGKRSDNESSREVRCAHSIAEVG
jgi:hypothetical protein